MAVVPVDRIPLQQLLFPILCADRQLCILHECWAQLTDTTDHIDYLGGHGALAELNLNLHHLQRAINLVKNTKLLHVVRFQRALHTQWRQHGMVPPIDFEMDE